MQETRFVLQSGPQRDGSPALRPLRVADARASDSEDSTMN